MTRVVTVLITASSMDEARSVARGLLEQKLVACVNIVPGVESHYWWQGTLETAQECLLVAKSRPDLVERVTAEVKRLHSYTVPEVIALPVVDGNPAYLDWVAAETT